MSHPGNLPTDKTISGYYPNLTSPTMLIGIRLTPSPPKIEMSDSRVVSLSRKGSSPEEYLGRTEPAYSIYELNLDLVVVYPSQKGSLPTDPTDVVCTGLFNQYDLVVINPSQKGSVPTDPTDKVYTGLFS